MTDHPPETASLIDRRLDGGVDDATWTAACASDPTLTARLANARAVRATIAALPHPPLDPALRARLLARAPRAAAAAIPFPRWTLRRVAPLAAAAVLALIALPLALDPVAANRAPILPLAELRTAPPATGGALSTWSLSVRQGGLVTLAPAEAGPIGSLRIEALDAQGRVLLSVPARPAGIAPASIVAPGESWQIDLGRIPEATRIRLRRGDEVSPPLPLP
jgi:hypothetical protein